MMGNFNVMEGNVVVRIAIVEDNENDIRMMTEYINRYNAESDSDISFDVYTDGAMLVEKRNKSYDIIIMDIEMPLLDGMGAAEEIRKSDDEVIIIFVTSMAQYAIKGYEVGALDYILKPVSYFALSQRLNKAISRLNKAAAQYIAVRINRGVQKLDVADIKYIESQKNLLAYHTVNEKLVTYSTLKVAEAELKDMNFSKGNNGCLINLRHVDAIRDGCAIVGEAQISLSRSRRADFEAALIKYIGETTK